MTNPFQSIMGQPDSAPKDTQRSFEATLEDLRKEEQARASQSQDELLSDEGNSPNPVPTGLDWDAAAQAGDLNSLLLSRRKPLCGGIYNREDALKLLNEHFFIGKNNKEIGIFRLNNDGSATFMPPEQFKLEVQNIFVKLSANKTVPAEKFWKENPYRLERVIVFKPAGTTNLREFNLWRGFGVEPHPGWQKQRRLLRHIREVICQRDRHKFKYLIRFLAFSVQNPDKHSGVILTLKSRKQGTGKSTLGKVMLDIFGPHGALIDDKERLLGRFTDWLETTCFVLAEEILWPGDHKAGDKLKSMITADTIQIERKFGSCRQIPNRLKTLATTNHDHSTQTGVRDRRNVVYEVSDERIGDKAWFNCLYRDLATGGTSEFLNFLLNVQLGSWHPREILKTVETVEQQRMSGDSISQWAQACIDADAIGARGAPQHDLATLIAVKDLRNAYTDYCKQQGVRAANPEVFGKACAEMFGPRKRMSPATSGATTSGATTQTAEDTGASDTNDAELDQRIAGLCKPEAEPTKGKGHKPRPWGYEVPEGEVWQEKVDERLGIKK